MNEDLSLMEFCQLFPTVESCINHIEKVRWDGVVKCPRCNGTDFYNRTTTSPKFKCKPCRYNFSHTAGTIFDNSKVPLTTWFFLIYSEAVNKKNTSSLQAARNLKLTQKTLWGMQHKIRMALKQPENTILSGVVEADECFIGKGNRWTRWGGISTRKTPVFGLVQRGGSVIIKTVEDRKRATLVEIIKQHVAAGSTIYTDGHMSYKNLPPEYTHDFVEHSTHEYVRGDVHTNTIENVWGFFKKSIRNAHHSISAKHVQIYCDQTAFRFNNRNLNGYEKFNKMMELCMQGSVIFRDKEKSEKYYLQS